MWTLPNTPQTQQNVAHALRLLQTPCRLVPNAGDTSSSAETSQAIAEGATSVTRAPTTHSDSNKANAKEPVTGTTHVTKNATHAPVSDSSSAAVGNDESSAQARSEAVLSTDATSPPGVAQNASACDGSPAGIGPAVVEQRQLQPPTDQQGLPQPASDAPDLPKQSPQAIADGRKGAQDQQVISQPASDAPGWQKQSPQAIADGSEGSQAVRTADSNEPSKLSTDGRGDAESGPVQAINAASNMGRNGDQAIDTADTTSPGLSTSPALLAVEMNETHGNVLDSTPAMTQQGSDATPSAPQHAAKPRVHSDASLSVQKPLVFTSAAQNAAGAAAGEHSQQTTELSQQPGSLHVDVAALIREEFAELMASDQHTPTEAAILALQHVSAAQQQ